MSVNRRYTVELQHRYVFTDARGVNWYECVACGRVMPATSATWRAHTPMSYQLCWGSLIGGSIAYRQLLFNSKLRKRNS